MCPTTSMLPDCGSCKNFLLYQTHEESHKILMYQLVTLFDTRIFLYLHRSRAAHIVALFCAEWNFTGLTRHIISGMTWGAADKKPQRQNHPLAMRQKKSILVFERALIGPHSWRTQRRPRACVIIIWWLRPSFFYMRHKNLIPRAARNV